MIGKVQPGPTPTAKKVRWPSVSPARTLYVPPELAGERRILLTHVQLRAAAKERIVEEGLVCEPSLDLREGLGGLYWRRGRWLDPGCRLKQTLVRLGLGGRFLSMSRVGPPNKPETD